MTPEEYTDLYHRYAPALRRYFAVHRQECDADDLAQDVFVRVWAKRAQFQPGTNARAWLYRIARNRLMDVHRQRHGIGLTPLTPALSAYWALSDHDGPEARALQAERRQAVRQTLARLTAKQRQALWQHDALEEPIRLGPERTRLKHRVHMGRAAFRQRYPRSLREVA